MYYRVKRLSFYLTKSLFWLRIRDKNMAPKGLFLRAGRE